MQENIRPIVIALVGLLIISIIIQVITNNNATTAAVNGPTPVMPPTNLPITRVPVQDVELVVNRQSGASASSVLVAKVFTKAAGWISIHVDDNGNPDSGNVGYVSVKKGLSTNVKVPLRTSKLTQRLWAMLHVDTGKLGVFEFPGKDLVAKTNRGKMVSVPFEFPH